MKLKIETKGDANGGLNETAHAFDEITSVVDFIFI
jgi:hypothetical protein